MSVFKQAGCDHFDLIEIEVEVNLNPSGKQAL